MFSYQAGATKHIQVGASTPHLCSHLDILDLDQHAVVFLVDVVALDLAVRLLQDFLAFCLAALHAVPAGRLGENEPGHQGNAAERELG